MAIIAAIAFAVSLILHLIKTDPFIVSAFSLGGLLFVALHLLFGNWPVGAIRTTRRQ